MSLLFDRKAPTETRATYSLKELGIAMAGTTTSGGPRVGSVDAALRDAATWACVKIKAQGVAMLPVDVVRYEGKRRLSVPAPPVVASPSALVPRRVWVFQLAWSLFTDANAFGKVVDVDPMGRPAQVELIAPEMAKQRKVVDGVPQVTVNNEVWRRYPYGDLWHMAGEMVPAGSAFGLSPIEYGARVTGTSLAAEQFGGQFFTDGGHPTKVFKVPGQPTEKQTTDLKARLMSVMRGNREPLLVPLETIIEDWQVDPESSQFIDLMRFEVEQTCRRHGVPPGMVYGAVSGQNVTYSNATQADLHYLKHTLSYPIDLIEDAWSALLPNPRVVKFNRDAILEGDPMAKVEMHAIRLKNRIATVNEVRALDDHDPFGPEFDIPGIPPLPVQPSLFDQGGAE